MLSAEIPNKQIKENRRKWEGGVLKNIMSTFSEQKLIWGHQGQNGVQRISDQKKLEKKTQEKR